VTALHVATRAGLVQVDESGRTNDVNFEGSEVVSVAARGDVVAIAVSGGGVWLRAGGRWCDLGLEDAIVWTVALAGPDEIYAGVEPAALWRLGSDEPRELLGLRSVAGHEDWHSPWGPADLSSIVADGDRLFVGIEIGGVAVSHDRGVTWEARNNGLFDDVHVVLADGPLLYATTGMGCFLSHDEGRQWAWASDGIEHGYTLGLAWTDDAVVLGAASGPPSLWEAGGPEAAIYRSSSRSSAAQWEQVFDEFAGAVERSCLQARGALVVAGTTAGELLVSRDGGRTFSMERSDLGSINSVAISE
jgi:hypothetical protein